LFGDSLVDASRRLDAKLTTTSVRDDAIQPEQEGEARSR